MSNFLNSDEIFEQQKTISTWTIHNITENQFLYQKFCRVSDEIQYKYDLDQSLAHQITLYCVNASNGLIDSSNQLLEHLGLKELEDSIVDKFETIYSEAGIFDQTAPKVDILGKFIGLAKAQEEKKDRLLANKAFQNDQTQKSGFSFLDNL